MSELTIDNIEKVLKEHPIHERNKMSVGECTLNRYDKSKGEDGLYDCPKCKNKGLIGYLNEYNVFSLKKCDCYKKRNVKKRLKDMGLLEFVDNNNSLDSFITKEEWQSIIKEKAKRYLEKSDNNWFFIGGSIGTGKTKICTTIFAKLMESEKYEYVKYFRWDVNYRNLVFRNKDGKLSEEVEDMKDCDLLYIDDFLRSKNAPDYELEVAKNIIDYRYINNKVTIISSEKYSSEIISADESIGSRIYQMCGKGKYITNVKRDENRNIRMKEDLI